MKSVPAPRRVALVTLVVIVAIAAAVLITSGLQGTVEYYRTPTEVTQSQPPDRQTIRLGGQVMRGTLARDGAITTFRLTDGHNALLVVASGALPDTFREGQGAVVQGMLRSDGTFRADSVVVKHSNQYRPPAQGTP